MYSGLTFLAHPVYLPNQKSVALRVLIGGTQNWSGPWLCPHKGRSQGVGDDTVRKSVSEFLQAVHSNFSSIFSLYAFQRYCHFCSPERHFFPTTPLVSPKFTHVPLRVDGSPFRCKERRCWANCLCNYTFRDFQPVSQSTDVTDRRTDGRHAIARPRFALKCACAVKTVEIGNMHYFHHTVAPSLQFLRDNFHPEILTGPAAELRFLLQGPSYTH